MSKTRWFLVWLLFILYLFLGATIFYYIEHTAETKDRYEQRRERNRIYEDLKNNFNQSTMKFETLIDRLSDYCGKPMDHIDINDDTSDPYRWTYFTAFFYSLVTVTTVGYGNLTPSTTTGRMVMIMYSLLGVPFLSIVMGKMGDVFGKVFMKAHHRYKNKVYDTKWELLLVIFRYLIVGIFIFLIAPAAVISYMEDWPYSLAFYYSYVTLTTIGYGDYVAGQKNENTTAYTFYRIGVIIWVMIGLGYLVMILGFISRSYRSKRINRLEQKLATTIKTTQSKIWNEFVDDVSFVRRLLNEMYLLKVKPVYKENEWVRRELLSQSCPNLSEWPVLRKKSEAERKTSFCLDVPSDFTRRRAYSENMNHPHLFRSGSDGDLEKIDRIATFQNTAIDRSDERRISQMIDRIGTPHVSDDEMSGKGFDMFSDEEILASEGFDCGSKGSGSTWMIGSTPPIWTRPRSNTYSEPCDLGSEKIPYFNNIKDKDFHLNVHPKDGSLTPPTSGLRRMSSAAINFFSSNGLTQKFMKPQKPRDEKQSKDEPKEARRFSLQDMERHPARLEELNYLSCTSGRRPSILAALANSGSSPIHERTSLADLIRAMRTLEERKLSLGGSPERGPSPLPLMDLRRRSLSPYETWTSEMTRCSSLAPVEHKRVASFRLEPRRAPANLRRASLNPDTRLLPQRSESPLRPRASTVMTPQFSVPSLVITSPEDHSSASAHPPDDELSHIIVRL